MPAAGWTTNEWWSGNKSLQEHRPSYVTTRNEAALLVLCHPCPPCITALSEVTLRTSCREDRIVEKTDGIRRSPLSAKKCDSQSHRATPAR